MEQSSAQCRPTCPIDPLTKLWLPSTSESSVSTTRIFFLRTLGRRWLRGHIFTFVSVNVEFARRCSNAVLTRRKNFRSFEYSMWGQVEGRTSLG